MSKAQVMRNTIYISCTYARHMPLFLWRNNQNNKYNFYLSWGMMYWWKYGRKIGPKMRWMLEERGLNAKPHGQGIGGCKSVTWPRERESNAMIMMIERCTRVNFYFSSPHEITIKNGISSSNGTAINGIHINTNVRPPIGSSTTWKTKDQKRKNDSCANKAHHNCSRDPWIF